MREQVSPLAPSLLYPLAPCRTALPYPLMTFLSFTTSTTPSRLSVLPRDFHYSLANFTIPSPRFLFHRAFHYSVTAFAIPSQLSSRLFLLRLAFIVRLSLLPRDFTAPLGFHFFDFHYSLATFIIPSRLFPFPPAFHYFIAALTTPSFFVAAFTTPLGLHLRLSLLPHDVLLVPHDLHYSLAAFCIPSCLSLFHRVFVAAF